MKLWTALVGIALTASACTSGTQDPSSTIAEDHSATTTSARVPSDQTVVESTPATTSGETETTSSDGPPAQTLVLDFTAGDGASDEQVEVAVIDASGQQVASVSNGHITSERGSTVHLESIEIPVGTYRVEASTVEDTGKCGAPVDVGERPVRARIVTGPGCFILLDTPWFSADGRAVPVETMTEFGGAAHCDWDAATFLVWDDTWYAADPDGLFEEWMFLSAEDLERMGPRAYERFHATDSTVAVSPPPTVPSDATYLSYAELDALPEDAVSTGLTSSPFALWLSPEVGYAYLVDGDSIQRWPVMTTPAVCA